MSHRLIYVTTPNRNSALAIARTLLNEHLIACANILPAMTSVYRWEGRVTEDDEVVLLAKTRTDCAPKVIDRIRSLHSYSCPCILALAITDGDKGFLDWISTSCEG